MRKMLLNECRLNLRLVIPPTERLLVIEAERKEQQIKGDKAVQVTRPVRDNGRLYLPGSSIKGVLRSRAEYIANLLNGQNLGACHLFDPFFDKQQPEDALEKYRRMACGHRFALRQASAGPDPLTPPQQYRDACPACQLFGHTFGAGRLRVTDFTPISPEKTFEQSHIAVDRITGGVGEDQKGKGKLYRNTYVTDTSFQGQIVVENFSLWQLGWLGMLLRDLQDGLLGIGHKQSSGAGQVKVEGATVTLRVLSVAAPAPDRILGIGSSLNAPLRDEYGYREEVGVIDPLRWMRQGIWQEAHLTDKPLKNLWEALHPFTVAHLSQFAYRAAMTIGYLNQIAPAPPPGANSDERIEEGADHG